METLPSLLFFPKLDPEFVDEFRTLLVDAHCSVDVYSQFVAASLSKLMARSNLLWEYMALEVHTHQQNYETFIDILFRLDQLAQKADAMSKHCDVGHALRSAMGEAVGAYISLMRSVKDRDW